MEKSELMKSFDELKYFILGSKKFNVRDNFSLFTLLEDISKKIRELN